MNAGKGCLIGCLGMLAAVGLVVTGLVALMMVACIALGTGLVEDEAAGCNCSERDKIQPKVWVSGDGDEDDPVVLQVKISGVIYEAQEDLFGGDKSSAVSALRKIRAATRDEEVQGLYLVIDSPGGEVTLSDVIADAVQRFKAADTNRFVLVEMGSLCCSGGYYIAAGADYIIAHPTTVTGSIGVLMSSINAAELAKKIGIESVVIATGANKAMLDPLKPVDQEHVKIFRKAVDADYERFLSVVAKGRGLPVEEVRRIADGRILCAAEARQLKLVDAIGYSEEAESQLAKMANADYIRIVRYKDELTWRSLFDESFLSSKGMSRVLRGVSTGGGAGRPNFLY